LIFKSVFLNLNCSLLLAIKSQIDAKQLKVTMTNQGGATKMCAL
jgi:hypothetical protein